MAMLDAPAITPNDRAERSAPRVVGALLLIAAGVIHFAELGDVEVPYLVVGFFLSALFTVAGAVLLLTRAPRLGWLLGGTVAGLTLVGYLLSRSVGLPGLDEEVGAWAEPLGILSVVVEAAAAGLAIWALTDRHGVSRRHAVEEIKAVTPGLTESRPESGRTI
jgi:hypothetical protein